MGISIFTVLSMIGCASYTDLRFAGGLDQRGIGHLIALDTGTVCHVSDSLYPVAAPGIVEPIQSRKAAAFSAGAIRSQSGCPLSLGHAQLARTAK